MDMQEFCFKFAQASLNECKSSVYLHSSFGDGHVEITQDMIRIFLRTIMFESVPDTNSLLSFGPYCGLLVLKRWPFHADSYQIRPWHHHGLHPLTHGRCLAAKKEILLKTLKYTELTLSVSAKRLSFIAAQLTYAKLHFFAKICCLEIKHETAIYLTSTICNKHTQCAPGCLVNFSFSNRVIEVSK